ncbi:hypothetical protein LY78DRAFT_447357 [Colletotrichum sublineola]|nr:hypothetical protein LY78DRAFT_447357 [Colletotrichum sublineola]
MCPRSLPTSVLSSSSLPPVVNGRLISHCHDMPPCCHSYNRLFIDRYIDSQPSFSAQICSALLIVEANPLRCHRLAQPLLYGCHCRCHHSHTRPSRQLRSGLLFYCMDLHRQASTRRATLHTTDRGFNGRWETNRVSKPTT